MKTSDALLICSMSCQEVGFLILNNNCGYCTIAFGFCVYSVKIWDHLWSHILKLDNYV